MRTLVTGAAGFIGSHLAAELPTRGHDVVGVDSFTDYYDPARKHANAVGLDVADIELEDADLDVLLAGVDGVFHLAGQPGVRSFGDVFALYLRRNVLASQRVFEAAARRRPRRLRVVVVDLRRGRAVPDRGGRPAAARSRRTGSRSSAASTSRTRTPASFGLDAVVLRYFNAYGPRQRPDMAFTRILEAPRRRDAVPALRRRPPVAELHLRRRRRPRDDRGDGGWQPAPTTSAAVRRRRCATRSRSSRSLPAAASRSATTRPCPATSGARTADVADPHRARLGADDDAAGRARGPVGVGRC